MIITAILNRQIKALNQERIEKTHLENGEMKVTTKQYVPTEKIDTKIHHIMQFPLLTT